MARRIEFLGVANGVVGSFNSRNNDIDGYWGIGKLYAFAQSKNTDTVELDILNKTVFPETKEFNSLLDFYNELFTKQIKGKSIPAEWALAVVITARFEQEYQYKYHYWGSALGKPYIIDCDIIDDNNRKYIATLGNNCRPHNPKKESRSTRANDF